MTNDFVLIVFRNLDVVVTEHSQPHWSLRIILTVGLNVTIIARLHRNLGLNCHPPSGNYYILTLLTFVLASSQFMTSEMTSPCIAFCALHEDIIWPRHSQTFQDLYSMYVNYNNYFPARLWKAEGTSVSSDVQAFQICHPTIQWTRNQRPISVTTTPERKLNKPVFDSHASHSTCSHFSGQGRHIIDGFRDVLRHLGTLKAGQPCDMPTSHHW